MLIYVIGVYGQMSAKVECFPPPPPPFFLFSVPKSNQTLNTLSMYGDEVSKYLEISIVTQVQTND